MMVFTDETLMDLKITGLQILDIAYVDSGFGSDIEFLK
jgi:hypothetical protein